MKKFLLLAVATALAVPGICAEDSKNLELPSFYLMGISPNAKYAVSYIDNNLFVLNLETLKTDSFIANDPTYMTDYSGGNGNFIANDGTVAGSSTSMGSAAYYKDGKVYLLDVPDPELVNIAQGITPDGSVICGQYGNAAMSLDAENIMCLPCVWYRNSDGTYGDIVKLPYPTTDFTGNTPQYITAVSISADGKTVIGQVRDNSGFYHEPIVYTRDDKGEWSYKLIAHQLFNKEGLTYPRMPELEYPMEPYKGDYLNEEEMAAYEAAMEAFNAGQTQEMPDMVDFMSQENVEKFNKDYADFLVADKEYKDAWTEYQTAYDEFMDGIPAFVFNAAYISPDGKRYVTGTAGDNGIWMSQSRRIKSRADEGIDIEDPGMGDFEETETAVATPYIFDIATGEYTTIASEKGIYPTCITNDYTVFGTYDIYALPLAVAIPAGSDSYMMLEDYIGSFSPESKDWMKAHMLHDIDTFDPDTWEDITLFDQMCSGSPWVSADQKVFGTRADNIWDMDDENYYYCYIIFADKGTGVSVVPAADFNVKALEGGIVRVEGAEATVEIFNAAGAMVFSTRAAGDIATNLSGLYIVRATAADGTVKTVKAAF